MRLQYDIAITGQAAVKAALAGIERRFVEHNKRMARQAGVTPGKTGQAKSGDSQVLRAQRMQSGVDRFLHKQRLQQIKAEERARLASERAVAREARESQRRQERLFTNRARNRLKRIRINRREAAAAERAHQRFVATTVGRGASSVGSTARYIGGTAAGALALGGGALVGSALREATSVDQGIRRLLINSRGPGETSKYTVEEIGGKVRAASMVAGVNQADIVEGLQGFVGRTGDIDAAIANLETFATVSAATGAHMLNVANAGADLMQKMDVKSVEQMREAFATLIAQGKAGAFELRDLAAQAPRVLAQAQAFGMGSREGLRQLGGFLQIARSATGSPEQAATATEATFRQLATNADKLQSGKAFGGRKVQVYNEGDPTKGFRNVMTVITEMIAASRGDMTAIQKIAGEEGVRALRPLISTYQQAGGGDAGKQAITDLLETKAGKPGDFRDVERDAADALKGPAAELEQAFREAKMTLSKELMPVFVELVNAVTKLSPHLKTAAEWTSKFVDQLRDNPADTIGLLIVAKTTASIAAAGIGDAVKNAIVSRIAGSTMPQLGGTPAGGKAPKGKGGPPVAGAAGGAGLAGTAALLTTGLAVSQLDQLNRELGGNVSVNPFANRKGEVSVDSFLGTLLDTITFGATGDQGMQQRVGESVGQIMRGLLDFEDTSKNIRSGSDYTDLFGDPRTRQAEDVTRQLQAFDPAPQQKQSAAALDEFTAATKRAQAELAKLKAAELPNRGNSPSPVK